MTRIRELARAWMPRSVRNWLRSPGRSARWAWRELRFRAGAVESVQLADDWKLRCHPEVCRVVRASQVEDPEQEAELAAFAAACEPDMVLFDLGAHFGVFSMAALHYGGPRARAAAVDPSPVAIRMVEVQARLNGAADRIHAVRAAVSDREGTLQMIPVGVQADGYFIPSVAERGEREHTSVRAVTVDGLVAELGLVPTHVKIDVEGFEAAALRGGSITLSRSPAPRVFIELHNEMVRSRGEDPSESLSILEEHGYRLFALDGGSLSREDVLGRSLVRIVAERR